MASVYGKAESAKLLAAASAAFDETMKAEFQAERAYGADAVKKVYDAMVAGETDDGRRVTIRDQSRETPKGEVVKWTYSSPHAARGPRPFLIDWRGSKTSPHHTLKTKACKLASVTCYVEDGRVEKARGLLQTLGLHRLDAAGGEGRVVVKGTSEGPRGKEFAHGYLVAEVVTPKGRVSLG